MSKEAEGNEIACILFDLLQASDRNTSSRDRHYVLNKAAEFASRTTLSGIWIELGVFEGRSIPSLAKHAKERGERCFGLDSFVGLPDPSVDGRNDWMTKRFDRQGALPSVPHNVELVVGWFEDTLPQVLQPVSPIVLLHVDSDIYSSCAYALNYCTRVGAITCGTVIVFDELMHYDSFERNEILALLEWKEVWKVEFTWIAVKNKVLQYDEFEQNTARLKNYRRLRAEGYDQSAALVVDYIGKGIENPR